MYFCNMDEKFAITTLDPTKTTVKVKVGEIEYEMLLNSFINNLNIPTQFTLPYTIYSALLTQADALAPTVTVLQNTLVVTPVWDRGGAGNYRINNIIFDSAKTVVFLGPLKKAGSVQSSTFGPGYRQITTLNTSNIAEDGTGGSEFLNSTYIEIRVYP